MKRLVARLLCLTLLAGLSIPAVAQQRRTLGPVDGFDLPALDTGRVSIGVLAPDFTLESKNGEFITLSGFRGKKHVVLVFYRGHW